MKKIISIILIFTVLLVAFTLPAKAFAVELIGGSYAAYAILAAALAAAGYTVATSDITPEIFQGILDSPNAELIKALIGGTTMYATAKGSVYFNWTASQWATFTNWVNTQIVNGSLVIPSEVAEFMPSSSFVASSPSSYITSATPTRYGDFGWYISSNTVATVSYYSTKKVELHLSNGSLFGSQYTGYSDLGYTYYVFGSSVIANANDTLSIYVARGINSSGTVARSVNDIVSTSLCFGGTLNPTYNGTNVTIERTSQGLIRMNYRGTWYVLNNSQLFNKTYSSMIEYYTDCINTGSLVGDFTGIGDDVINPAYPETEVGIDAYPDYQVGVGADAVPDVIDGTLDIPLDRYIDTPIDLSQDPVPIDFTPWQDKTLDTTPEDVIPDVRVNPTTDIPSNPDIPWADTESYPIDYPTDTTTSDLPSDPNPNTPPEGDEANKLKLLPLVLSKFPFCLPWDLYHGVNSFFVTAEAPVFDIPLRSQNAGINETIHIDFNNYQTLANVSRWFFSALWVIILIMITRKIIWK